jgi:hypothetical protein
MTEKQFLKKISEFHDWRLTENGFIRRKHNQCPITTLCNKTADHWEAAAVSLKIFYNLAYRIVTAADNGDQNISLRKRLLKATHLEEKI